MGTSPSLDRRGDFHGDQQHTLYDTTEAAEYLRLSRSCLAKWRCGGGGPSFILAGRKVLYAKAVLDAWLASRSRRSTSDRGQ